MAYMSRAKRRNEACNSLRNVYDKLIELSGFLETVTEIKDLESIKEKINNAKTLIAELDTGELDSLKDEMESWASSMEGTNLENTTKYETVSESANNLGDIVSNLEEITVPEIDLENLTVDAIVEFASDIKKIADEIEDQVNDAENVDFPGMYG